MIITLVETRRKMAVILQTAFGNAFTVFHASNIFLGAYIKTAHYWFRQWLVVEQGISQYQNHELCSLSSKTSYRQISWSLEAARLGVILIVLLRNFTGISAALLPKCLSNIRAIRKSKPESHCLEFSQDFAVRRLCICLWQLWNSLKLKQMK